ncbi:MAG: response regulator [Candidatus Omnitrophica bacterium]|nr:response regulator [Candidatus Omnitrophota bacterium]
MPDTDARGIVLLVDDEMDFLKVAGVRLRQGNYKVLTAQDGQAGLAVARNGHPEVILLDLMMPKMNGHQVLQALKEDPKTQDIPVIVLSAVGDQRQIELSLSLGAACHMTKPYDSHELFKEMDLAIMRHREAHKAAASS